MPGFLLDTNVISEFAKPVREERVLSWMARQAPADLHLSTITLGELVRGVVRMPEGRRRRELAHWIHEAIPHEFRGRLLPFDEATAVTWGEIMGTGDRGGRRPPAVDAQIAATAIRHGLVLATRNTTDFRAIGVALFNPWDAA